MLTTNQVPFIAQVSVIPYSMGYESAKCLLCQVLFAYLQFCGVICILTVFRYKVIFRSKSFFNIFGS